MNLSCIYEKLDAMDRKLLVLIMQFCHTKVWFSNSTGAYKTDFTMDEHYRDLNPSTLIFVDLKVAIKRVKNFISLYDVSTQGEMVYGTDLKLSPNDPIYNMCGSKVYRGKACEMLRIMNIHSNAKEGL